MVCLFKVILESIVSLEEYHNYSRQNKNPRKGALKSFLTLFMQVLLLSIFFLFAVLLIFRWAPIPTSAFIFKQNQLAKQAPEIYENAVYSWISWDQIPKTFALAVIAAEDQRFPNHWGVDTIELRKAFSQNKKRKGSPRGASTITQQTAKNLFLWNGRSYFRKIIEAGLSVAIEIAWPKERILEVYLNIAQFGDAIYGVKEASRRLFDKTPKELTKEEAALLAAVLPKPSISNVIDPSPDLRKRQQWILKQMKQLGGVGYLRRL